MATRIKAQTLTVVPQSKSDCAEQIRQLGDLLRDFERAKAQMNDRIAAITAEHQPELDDMSKRAEALRSGIQAWCEANRVQLCGENDRLGKTANLVTGEVSWRVRPPSVRITGADSVVETLERTGLTRFVRVAKAVNKEAILNEPAAVRGIAGISLVSGVEDFVITPFEAQAEAA